MRHFWKKYHKWVGLFFTFFILMFCFSGIILNHRQLFSKCDISRNWLPSDYRYENWNNGAVKGIVKLPNHDVLAYGNTGVWKTDSCFSVFNSFNEGIEDGIDNRKISNITILRDSSVWCAGLFDIYCLSKGGTWETKTHLLEEEERIADIFAHGDTLVVLSRSHVYESLPPYTSFQRYELKAPTNYSPKVSLFRTVWLLHSGELFGTTGKIIVDLIALVLIVLCFSGLFYWFIPKSIRYRKKKHEETTKEVKVLKYAVLWHNKLGAWTLFFTIVLAATGMCLRPPLMIPLAMTSVKPVPGSTMDSDNPWHDKLRSIRWDDHQQYWLMSTSSGFYALHHFEEVPTPFKVQAPVSPMGINVFEKNENNEWLIGSFSGLFRWDITKEKVIDYFTGQPYQRTFGRPVASIAVSGIAHDIKGIPDVVFDYGKGARTLTQEAIHLADMPEELVNQPMSLWNFALELHVGRCYNPILGPFSSLFVFLSGLLLSLILISGYIIHRKRKPKKNGSNK